MCNDLIKKSKIQYCYDVTVIETPSPQKLSDSLNTDRINILERQLVNFRHADVSRDFARYLLC